MTTSIGGLEHDGLILKKQRSLKQISIPKGPQSRRSLRNISQSSSRISDDDAFRIAVPYNYIKPDVAEIHSVESQSTIPFETPSSVYSVASSRTPSTSRVVPKQQESDGTFETERLVETCKCTERRSGRQRASTLTNFSKPYGLLQEHTLIQNPQPVRKTSHQLLGPDSFDTYQRNLQRAATDGNLFGVGFHKDVGLGTASTFAGDSNVEYATRIAEPDGITRLHEPMSYSPERISHMTTLGQNDTRGSTQSLHSFGSSLQESKHSSTFTKISSTTEITLDMDLFDENKERISVNDVIDSYADLDESESPISSSTGGIDQTSRQIAEAMTAPIGSLRTPGRDVHPQSRPLISYQRVRNILHQPPTLRERTSTHDHYGFRNFSRDVTLESYNAWFQDYSKFQTRRNTKWQDLLSDHGISTSGPKRFPAPCAKVQRYIRKGIPPAWRGDAWFFYSGGAELLATQPDYYVDLVIRSQTDDLNRNDREAVERDLHRTFPDNIHFKTETTSTSTQIIETPIMTALRRILCAFAVDHPKIGYCQSLNFIAGLLLLFLPEEKAYWMLHIITTRLLPRTHELSLEGANIDLWVLMLALKQANPGVWAKVGGDVGSNSSRLPPVSLCTTSWFMSMFIGTLPIESVLRVWDVLFYEGSKTLFRIALAIFKFGEIQIRTVKDSMEIFQIVQTIPRKMVDVGKLFDIAFSRGEVGKRWIEKKRDERRAFYAKARVIEKARRDFRDTGSRNPSTSQGEDSISPTSTLIVEPRDQYWRSTRVIKADI